MRTSIHHRLIQLASWAAVALALLLVPATSGAQQIGRVACAPSGDYVYLYSSMVTLDIGGNLSCGQQVEVTGRYDNYFAVRTAKGEIGYVPLDALFLVKTTPGAKPAMPPATVPTPDKNHGAPAAIQFLVLLDSTAVRMKLNKSLSSADAHVDDEVAFEVSEDVIVDGLLVISKGAQAIGVVNETEPRKALGRGGKLSVLIRSVRLADNEQAVLRSGGEGKGSSSLMRAKDVTFPKDMDFVGYVNGNTRLKRENFHAAPEVADAPPTGTVSNVNHL